MRSLRTLSVFAVAFAGCLGLLITPARWNGSAQQAAPQPSKTEAYSYARLKGRQAAVFSDWAVAQATKTGTPRAPASAYAALDQTQRSTYEAITHALSRSKLTDANGVVLKASALDLVAGLDEIAGQVKGVGGDKQFRLYVRLVPDAVKILSKSRDFFRDKDNTVFHKEYPINYRQRGRVPTLQFSVANDEVHADIDVDYRSSKPPQALVNGHLRPANSDVRMGRNYLGHVGRWFGLVRWWRVLTEESEAGTTASATTASTQTQTAKERAARPPQVRTLTAEQNASAQEVAKAVNEFLTTWLIKRSKQRADDFLVKRPVACTNTDDDSENETVTGQIAIQEFVLLLDAGLKAKAKYATVDDAVETIEPWDPEMIFVDHPFKKNFALHAIEREEASEYLCDQTKFVGDPKAYGDFFVVDFTLKLGKESGGGLELLWVKEDGKWKIISYDILEP